MGDSHHALRHPHATAHPRCNPSWSRGWCHLLPQTVHIRTAQLSGAVTFSGEETGTGEAIGTGEITDTGAGTGTGEDTYTLTNK